MKSYDDTLEILNRKKECLDLVNTEMSFATSRMFINNNIHSLHINEVNLRLRKIQDQSISRIEKYQIILLLSQSYF